LEYILVVTLEGIKFLSLGVDNMYILLLYNISIYSSFCVCIGYIYSKAEFSHQSRNRIMSLRSFLEYMLVVTLEGHQILEPWG